jgi:short-subunit dehydrogenase
MRNLKHKRALLTGAASGIGRAVAEQLADEGVHLLLIDRDEPGLARVAELVRGQGVEVTTQTVDLADVGAIDNLVNDLPAEFREFDLLINNAGVVHFGPTAEMRPADLERLMVVNLLAPMRLTRRLLPMLLKRPEAHIVNVASMYGYVATAKCAAYHASKFGLLGFSESLHGEFRDTLLSVTTVCPGFVATKLFEHGISSNGDSGVPHPPAWLCTTPERVARRIVRAIRRRQRLVIITPLAWALYYTTRFAPWLLPLARRLHR